MPITAPRQVLAAAAVAAALAVAVNLAIRAVTLAVLDGSAVPYPLVLPPVVEFTVLPTLLGGLLFVLLRRFTRRPLRWFAAAAAAVVVLSWIAPVAVYLGGRIDGGVMLVLLAMHVVPAALLVAALSRVSPADPADRRA